MKKFVLLSILLLSAVLLLTGCQKEDPETDTSPSPSPTEAIPTYVAPTPEPTVTPMPMANVEWPEDPSEKLLVIDPVDLPAIDFEPYVVCTDAERLGLTFEMPGYWETAYFDENTKTLELREPLDDIRSLSSVPATVTITVSEMSTAQTKDDATAALNNFVENFRNQYNTLSVSSQEDNKMLDETGRYITYRLDYPIDEEGNSVRMRGRCIVVPVDKRLYTIRYMCPANRNSEYVNVYYKIRSTIKEL